MLSIRVELLTGRYTASRFDDRDAAEWPPHPARLFSALVDAWADADHPDPVERAVLAWLEQQPPPSLTCSRLSEAPDEASEVAFRDVMNHFVPVNDVTALSRDTSASYQRIGQAMLELEQARQTGTQRAAATAQRRLEKALAKARDDAVKAASPSGRESDAVAETSVRVLPEHRLRQPRSFPTVVPDLPRFWFTWPEATLDENLRAALSRLLARLGRLGHSSTLVACDLDDQPPEPTLVPRPRSAGSEYGLRVAIPGALEELETDYAVHQGTEPRTGPYPTIDYGYPVPSDLPRPQLGGDWLVLRLPGEGPRLSLPSTLGLTRAVREALLKHAAKPVPPFLTGHENPSTDSSESPGDASGDARVADTPPLAAAHLAIVPLAYVGHRHADGRLLGLALILPTSAGEFERQVLDTAMTNWQTANGLEVYTQRWSLRLDRVGWNPRREQIEKVASLSRSYWSRPARRWVSVTPVALDRHPGLLTDARPDRWERAVAHATETIRRSCQLTGLPEPDRIGIRLDGPLAAVPAAPGRRGQCFPGFRTRSGVPRIGVHVELEFDQPVAGPVLLGAGRYLGYGLCVPVDDSRGRQNNEDQSKRRRAKDEPARAAGR